MGLVSADPKETHTRLHKTPQLSRGGLLGKQCKERLAALSTASTSFPALVLLPNPTLWPSAFIASLGQGITFLLGIVLVFLLPLSSYFCQHRERRQNKLSRLRTKWSE